MWGAGVWELDWNLWVGAPSKTRLFNLCLTALLLPKPQPLDFSEVSQKTSDLWGEHLFTAKAEG